MSDFEETLDPDDWTSSRNLGHQMIDDAIAHLSEMRERPVWQEMPDTVRSFFKSPAPMAPQPLDAVYADLRENLLPYSMGNIHPRFWGWYMGSSNFTGALGDFLAAIDGSNLGGGNTAAAMIDIQVVNWFKELMGFPEDASGTLTSGGSMANMVALNVARNALAGVDVRAEGILGMPQPIRFYASDQVHSCHQKALETLGHGASALTEIESDDHNRISIPALQDAIAKDRANGIKPACIIGTAGTTNTGALDDLVSIAEICRREGIWFHVDGCIGAFLRLAPRHKHLVDGIDQADSIAMDPHKWLHTPFEAGCVLIRDAQRHFGTFEMHGHYLQMQERGLMAGTFLADYGFELSRGFKALKIWMSLKENGVEKLGRLIDQNIEQARYLQQLIAANPKLELVAPVDLNIVCFRYTNGVTDEDRLKELNTEIMLRVQESGLAVPSDTTLDGKHCLRVAINNHRTRRQDLGLFLDTVLHIGAELEGERRANA
ncbi:amino acid decarboxylase [Ruegeria sp. ANG-R]|uniref:pyridoxal phosphate-dependent decarboxylase family protein n=1 Tax=Ruegeria sp. ANG-R TaxID=1577903 RepID=UPI00057F8793|nr:aminotransferase class V-fold PLP-dependent enzyme [Ruegeria sp. ANG-R]KIC38706.1 amino acid decarboxylase [Ruegeria sp. ANG-R]